MPDETNPARDQLLNDELPRQDVATEPAPAASSTPTTPTAPSPTPVKKGSADDPLRGSRTSGFWAAVVGLGIVLVLLIIFIAQNTRQTTVSFLGWDGQVPVAVAILIAAVAGLFLAGLAGTLRILQLRRRVRRTRRR